MTQGAYRFGPRWAAALAAGAVAWAFLAGLSIATAPSGPEERCASSIYRDPVTGRTAALGGATLTPDGRVLCPGGGPHGLMALLR